jgi:hypothetical protein
VHLHDGRVHLDRLNLDAHDLFPLQQFEDGIKDAALGPPIHAGIDGMPGAETFGQSAPFAALLGHIKHRVEKLQIGYSYVAALAWQRGINAAILLFGYLHSLTIAEKSISVNTP